MALASRTGTLTVLQNAVAVAANGVAPDISGASKVLVEILGTYTGITANFEASVDGGTTWFSVSLAQLSSLTLARVAAATATGLYRLEDCAGLSHFRARTTIGSPTGTMTVKAQTGW